MAITLNLKHTFSTRVVLSTEDVNDLRDAFKQLIEAVEQAKQSPKFEKASRKDQAKALAACERMKQWLAMSDEELVLSVIKDGFKNHFKESVSEHLKGKLYATDVSPVQTAQVKR